MPDHPRVERVKVGRGGRRVREAESGGGAGADEASEARADGGGRDDFDAAAVEFAEALVGETAR